MRLVASRLTRLGAVLLAVTFASFSLVSLLPGDTVTAILGERASEEARQQARADLGLDDPLPVRYVSWLGRAVQGDLGISYRTLQPVSEAIGDRIWVTLELVALSQLIALAIAVPMAIAGAMRQGSWIDRTLSGVQLGLLAIPSYLVAVLLLAVFAVQLGWFPTVGWVPFSESPFGNLRVLALPAIALGLEQVALYARVLRTDLARTLGDDFIRYARAKGVPNRRIMIHHAVRPSSLGLVTLAGVSTGRLLGGTVLIETIFSLPGLGRYTFEAINNRDFMALQGAVVVLTVGFVLINFAVDMLLGVIDPRIRSAEVRV